MKFKGFREKNANLQFCVLQNYPTKATISPIWLIIIEEICDKQTCFAMYFTHFHNGTESKTQVYTVYKLYIYTYKDGKISIIVIVIKGKYYCIYFRHKNSEQEKLSVKKASYYIITISYFLRKCNTL